jgi:hypothetical protein
VQRILGLKLFFAITNTAFASNDIVAIVASAALATVTNLIVAPELNNLTFGPPLKVDAAPTVVPQAASAPNNLILILFLR